MTGRVRMAGRTLARAALLAFVATTSCGREITGPLAGGREARAIAVLPQFRMFDGQASLASGVAFDRVRLTLTRLDGSAALARVVDFPAGSDSIALSLSVTLGRDAAPEGERLVLAMQFITAAGDTVFRSGPDTLFVAPARVGQTPLVVAVDPVYVGPGAEATSVALALDSLSLVAGSPFSFTAIATDASENPVPLAPVLFTSSDTMRLRFADPRSGVATVLASRGAVTVTARLLTGPSDSAFVSVLLPASAIAATAGNLQGGSVGAALATPVTVRVTASDGVGVAGVPVQFAAGNGGAPADSSVPSDANGFASVAWTLGSLVGTQTLTATAAGLSGSPVTFTATAVSTAATALDITSGPSNAVAGATLPVIEVVARDAQGNPATDFAGPITLALAPNAGNATLLGTTTVAAVTGVATFTDLRVERAGVGFTLIASSDTLDVAASAAFDVTPAAASALAFSVEPSAAAVGEPMLPPVAVTALDAFGNVATDFTGTVTLALGSNPGGATLGGTLAAAAVAGVATFADLTLDAAGSGYTLLASASGLSGASSAAFTTVSAVIAWINAAGGSWSQPANWSLGRVPLPTDSVVIALAGSYTVTLDTTFTGSHLAVGATSGTQTLSLSSRTLTLSGSLSIADSGALSLTSAAVTGSGSITNAGRLFARNSTLALDVTNAGTLRAYAATSVMGGVATTTATSRIEVEGDGAAGTSTLTFANGLTNNGVIELRAVTSAYDANIVVSNGTLTNASGASIYSVVGTGGARSIGAALENHGLVHIQQPTSLSRSGAAHVNDGSIVVEANLSVTQSGIGASFTNTGSIAVATGRTLGFSGGTVVLGGSLEGDGLAAFSSVALSLPQAFATDSLDLDLVGTTVGGAGSLEVSLGSTMSFRSGSQTDVPLALIGTLIADGTTNVVGGLTTAATSVLRVQPSGATGSALINIAGNVTNLGAVELTATVGGYPATLASYSGAFTNAAGATITALPGSGGSRTLSGAFANEGSLVIQHPLTWSNSVASVNSGLIDVVAGGLTVNLNGASSLTTSGTISIAAGTSVSVTNGSFGQGGGSIIGAGPLALTNVTVLNTGTLINGAGRSLWMRNVTANGPIQNDGTLTVVRSSAFNAAFIASSGSLLRIEPNGETGTTTLTVANGFTNAGDIELTSLVGGYNAELVVSAGTLLNASGGEIRSLPGTGGNRLLSARLDNAGLLSVQHPLTLAVVSGAASNSGVIEAAANLNIAQSGTSPSFTTDGLIAIDSGRTVQSSGGSFVYLGGSLDGRGTLALANGVADIAAPLAPDSLDFAFSAATVGGTGGVTLAAGRLMTLRATTLATPLANGGLLHAITGSAIASALTTAPGSTIRIAANGESGSSSLTVDSGFTNNGTIELSSTVGGYPSALAIGSGTLVNAASGSIVSLPGAGGTRSISGSVANDGLLLVDAPLTVTLAGDTLTNTGALSLTNGNLLLSQAGTSQTTLGGTVDIPVGRVLTVNGGALAQAGESLTGSGTLAVTNATVNGGVFTLSSGLAMQLRGTTVSAPFVNDGFTWVVTNSALTGAVTNSAGATLRIASNGESGATALSVATGFVNDGAIELSSTVGGYNATLDIVSGTLVNAVGGSITALPGSGGNRTISGSVANNGQVQIDHPLSWSLADDTLSNAGTLDVGNGNLNIAQTGLSQVTLGGVVSIGSGRALGVTGGGVSQVGNAILGPGTLSLTSATVNGGTFTVPNPLTLHLRGTTIAAPLVNEGLVWAITNSAISGSVTNASGATLRVAANGESGSTTLSVANGVVNDGTIELTSTGGGFASALTIGSGTLTNATTGTISVLPGTGGSRTISGSVDNQGLLSLAPDAAVLLSIGGNLSTSGSIAMDIGGLAAGTQHDRINVSGTITLDGALDVGLFNGFVPVLLDSFTLLSAGGVTGQFSLANILAPLVNLPIYSGTEVTVGLFP